MDKIEQILWTDPQRQKETGRCRVCGGVTYPPSNSCIRCGRDKP